MSRRDIENNIDGSYIYIEEPYDRQIRYLAITLAVLACLRILSFELLAMLSDGLGVLMVFFFFQSRGKCMAILLMFNGVLGIILGFSKLTFTYRIANATWFNLYYFLLFSISFYALLVYSFECYIAFIGIKTYEWDSAFGFRNNNRNLHYQGVATNPPITTASATNVAPTTTYVAFSGKGTAVGA